MVRDSSNESLDNVEHGLSELDRNGYLAVAMTAIGRVQLPLCSLLLLCACCSETPAPEATPWQETADWHKLKKEIRQTFPDVPVVTVPQLREELRRDARPILLDARAAEEFAVSHLAGARLAPDLEAASKVLSDSPKDRAVVVYCSVGYRSAALTQRLRERGYTNVRNLEGSLFEWCNRGLPVQRDGKTVEQVHPYDRTWGRFLDRRYWDFGKGDK